MLLGHKVTGDHTDTKKETNARIDINRMWGGAPDMGEFKNPHLDKNPPYDLYVVDRPLKSMRVDEGRAAGPAAGAAARGMRAPTTQLRSTSQEDIDFWCNQQQDLDNQEKICGWLKQMKESQIWQRNASGERVCAVF